MKVYVSKSKFRPFCRLGKEELETKLFLGPASFFRGGRCGVCGVGAMWTVNISFSSYYLTLLQPSLKSSTRTRLRDMGIEPSRLRVWTSEL